ncbi:MAG: hypothetical protein GQE15_26405 [Archangiaceae bacterium]|nr:hypothetical protein [Archangiaceae bacterium]
MPSDGSGESRGTLRAGRARSRWATIQRFVQADDSRTRSHQGRRLGRALSKQLTELMGGTLTLESMSNGGRTLLPARAATSSERVTATEQGQGQGQEQARVPASEQAQAQEPPPSARAWATCRPRPRRAGGTRCGGSSRG